jgi:hypothetical protein
MNQNLDMVWASGHPKQEAMQQGPRDREELTRQRRAAEPARQQALCANLRELTGPGQLLVPALHWP